MWNKNGGIQNITSLNKEETRILKIRRCMPLVVEHQKFSNARGAVDSQERFMVPN